MTTPRASGPLWATVDHQMVLDHAVVFDGRKCMETDIPCRLIPGHGKVVPVELVEAIEDELGVLMEPTLGQTSMREIAEFQSRMIRLARAAIRAALEGAV